MSGEILCFSNILKFAKYLQSIRRSSESNIILGKLAYGVRSSALQCVYIIPLMVTVNDDP